jgi:hypothetical protein
VAGGAGESDHIDTEHGRLGHGYADRKIAILFAVWTLNETVLFQFFGETTAVCMLKIVEEVARDEIATFADGDRIARVLFRRVLLAWGWRRAKADMFDRASTLMGAWAKSISYMIRIWDET